MPQYILLLRDDRSAFRNLSPEQLQAIYLRYRTWRESLTARGLKPAGAKLRDEEGRIMKQPDGKLIVTDGPYAEAREILGGFFQFEADNFEQAVEIARDCPHLDYGTIEIREIEVV